MSLYKENFKIFSKYKILWMLLLLHFIANTGLIIQDAYETFGEWISLLDYTRQILLLSPQILVLYTIIGYEFFSEPYRTNLSECTVATTLGYQNKHLSTNLAVVTTVLFINCLLFTAFDLCITHLDIKAHGIHDIDYQCTVYIIKCLFVNIFIIGFIGVLAGALLSKISRRSIAYTAIMAIIFCTSYLLNEVAIMVMVLTNYSVNLYDLLGVLNIMTPGLKFTTDNALGFPMMSYRICLILFWVFFLLLIYCFINSKKQKVVKFSGCITLCVVMFIGYAMPASRVDLSMNSSGSGMADQRYYATGNYHMQEVPSEFLVKKYTMDLDVRRLLKAKVTMKVSKALKSYRFTLSHSYNIDEVYNQDCEPLKFERYKDELLVHSGKARTETITVKYNGASEAYYSNSQGLNLPGSFPYYPIAGYRKITDDGFLMIPLFLENHAEFDIRIKNHGKIYTNLERKEKGHYVGKSNGLSLYSGMYAVEERHGIRITYPFLNGWGDTELEKMTSALKEAGYAGCKVFICPNVNKNDNAISHEQIITGGYFESIEDLQY